MTLKTCPRCGAYDDSGDALPAACDTCGDHALTVVQAALVAALDANPIAYWNERPTLAGEGPDVFDSEAFPVFAVEHDAIDWLADVCVPHVWGAPLRDLLIQGVRLVCGDAIADELKISQAGPSHRGTFRVQGWEPGDGPDVATEPSDVIDLIGKLEAMADEHPGLTVTDAQVRALGDEAEAASFDQCDEDLEDDISDALFGWPRDDEDAGDRIDARDRVACIIIDRAKGN